MGLERGVGQGFLWACLGPQLRAGEAQEEDRDWLLGSGEGLLGERRVCNEKGTFRSTPPTRYVGQEVHLGLWSPGPLSCHLGRFAIPFPTCCLVSAGYRLWPGSQGLWAIRQRAQSGPGQHFGRQCHLYSCGL